jgi:hypothetical protein
MRRSAAGASRAIQNDESRSRTAADAAQAQPLVWLMPLTLRRAACTVAAAGCLFGSASNAHAQDFEVTPFGGYRFGGHFFELITQQPVDVDGAAALGIIVDVPLSGRGLQFEALFTHQHARVITPAGPLGPDLWHISVDHWLAGGTQEFTIGPGRPFPSGLFGVTRYAAEGDSEIRFTIGAGGGLKLFPGHHIGLRLDSRAFATFVDVDTNVIVCSAGRACFTALRVDVAWQAEFTAGLIVRFF